MEMDWNKLLSQKRLNVEDKDETAEPGRTVFHKACDRIIFSSS